MEGNQKNASKNSEICPVPAFGFIENHYIGLPSQGNVYTFIPLQSSSRNTRMLTASLQRKVFCIEYNEGEYQVQENHLGLPNGADIVSMDAYSKNNRHEVGLTMILKDGTNEQGFLYFYSDWDAIKGHNVNQEFSNCTSIRLNYLPYALYHTFFPSSSGTELVWLLSGSDRCIHLFRLCKETGPYQGGSAKERLFPEFGRVHGITLHMDVWYSSDMKSRKTATSGEGGNVQLFEVDLSDFSCPVLKASRDIDFDFPASSVRFFHRRNQGLSLAELGIDFGSLIFDSDEKTKDEIKEPLVLVTTTLESCFVYSTDIESGPRGCLLPESESCDVVTCSLVCDVDFDGCNEIILGTYGQVVLIYKEQPDVGEWKLMNRHPLSSPVLALAYEDILGDGAKELVVSTISGVHVLQVSLDFTLEVILKRLRKLQKSRY